MSTVGAEGRSYAPITHDDLHRLLAIAAADRTAFFARHPEWAALYADRLLLVALCQGAALHYLHGEVGINDFDVYSFYAVHPDRAWHARRRAVADSDVGKFGVSSDQPHFVGRRVDLLGRSIAGEPGGDPVAAVRGYLRGGRTATAKFLAQKAVVVLAPVGMLGWVIWPQP